MAGEVGVFTTRNPDTVRAPDVLYLSRERDAGRTRRDGFPGGRAGACGRDPVPDGSAGRRAAQARRVLRGRRAPGVGNRPCGPDGSLCTRPAPRPRSLTAGDVLAGEDVLPGVPHCRWTRSSNSRTCLTRIRGWRYRRDSGPARMERILDIFWNWSDLVQLGGDGVTYALMAAVGTLLFLIRLVVAMFAGDAGDFRCRRRVRHSTPPSRSLSLLSVTAFIMGTGWMGLACRFDWDLSRPGVRRHRRRVRRRHDVHGVRPDVHDPQAQPARSPTTRRPPSARARAST